MFVTRLECKVYKMLATKTLPFYRINTTMAKYVLAIFALAMLVHVTMQFPTFERPVREHSKKEWLRFLENYIKMNKMEDEELENDIKMNKMRDEGDVYEVSCSRLLLEIFSGEATKDKGTSLGNNKQGKSGREGSVGVFPQKMFRIFGRSKT